MKRALDVAVEVRPFELECVWHLVKGFLDRMGLGWSVRLEGLVLP